MCRLCIRSGLENPFRFLIPGVEAASLHRSEDVCVCGGVMRGGSERLQLLDATPHSHHHILIKSTSRTQVHRSSCRGGEFPNYPRLIVWVWITKNVHGASWLLWQRSRQRDNLSVHGVNAKNLQQSLRECVERETPWKSCVIQTVHLDPTIGGDKGVSLKRCWKKNWKWDWAALQPEQKQTAEAFLTLNGFKAGVPGLVTGPVQCGAEEKVWPTQTSAHQCRPYCVNSCYSEKSPGTEVESFKHYGLGVRLSPPSFMSLLMQPA